MNCRLMRRAVIFAFGPCGTDSVTLASSRAEDAHRAYLLQRWASHRSATRWLRLLPCTFAPNRSCLQPTSIMSETGELSVGTGHLTFASTKVNRMSMSNDNALTLVHLRDL
ncbi:hypothetical protein RRG08_040161 [Elysia crispata]|uniref:Uncharacterized protein n=1 Tax=Elysia crispata TaxID=231223 RepID=A0AAE0XWS5_9GAST|nr:hypothetical protein RRG08_040161 [Elysia crispata]